MTSQFPCRRAPAHATCKMGDVSAQASLDKRVNANAMNTLPMTVAGYSALEDELKRRTRERFRLTERIQQAIADEPNLAENSEYQSATAEQKITLLSSRTSLRGRKSLMCRNLQAIGSHSVRQ
jgi:Transcription elongation factor, N-terminal